MAASVSLPSPEFPAMRRSVRYHFRRFTIAASSARVLLSGSTKDSVICSKRFDPIKNPFRNFFLGQRRQFGNDSLAIDDLDLIGIAAKSRAGLSEVVGDNKIKVLLNELFGCVFDQVLRFRGKTDENRSPR